MCEVETPKKKGNKKLCDVAIMWLNWSVATISTIFQFLDIYMT